MNRTTTAVLTALTLLLAACGGGGDEGVADQEPSAAESAQPAEADPGQDQPAGYAVVVQGFRFQPDRLEVAAGATVTWANEDDIEHTATAGTPEAPGEEFRVELAGKGAQGSAEFATPGTYAYFCEVHNSMLGEIVVV